MVGRCTQGVDIQIIGDYVSRRHVCIDMQRYETRVYRHENASSDIKVQGVPVIGNRKQLVLPWQIIQIGPDLEPLFVLTVGDSFASSTDGIWSIRLGALTAKQSRAIIAVLMCGSVKKAAELCGIKRTTFGRHLRTSLGREAKDREISLNFNAIPEPVQELGNKYSEFVEMNKSLYSPKEVQDLQRNIGSLVREAREDLGLEIWESAERIGITEGYLQRIENGMAMPYLATMIEIADELGISFDDMLVDVNGDETMPAPELRSLPHTIRGIVDKARRDPYLLYTLNLLLQYCDRRESTKLSCKGAQ